MLTDVYCILENAFETGERLYYQLNKLLMYIVKETSCIVQHILDQFTGEHFLHVFSSFQD